MLPFPAPQPPAPTLPPGITVFERGWLSANNILLRGRHGGQGSGSTALIDTGYCTHATQTVALVQQALGAQPLDLLLNTHLHSDHCGGNAALQQRYPAARTLIPPGQAAHVRHWDADALSYTPTGQECPPFRCDGLLQPGHGILLGDTVWQIHAAPGHDPHSVVLFEPAARLLVSADALWHNGFGVVFPELEGERAFEEVGATLALIADLQPRTVIPGHGAVFTDVDAALDRARRRLDSFVRDPLKHAHYAAKVLLKFKLLELQRVPLAALRSWATHTPYFSSLHTTHFAAAGDIGIWADTLVDDLVRSGAAERDGGDVLNL